MLKTIDSILLSAWKFLLVFFKAVSLLLGFILNVFKAILQLLSRIPIFARFSDPHTSNNIFHSRFFEYAGEKCTEYGKAFSNKMLTARVFRRCTFMVAFLVLLLYSYPPSHWGPWRYYQSGVASYYSTGFWFKKTASGERFIPLFYTAAHKTLPLGITVKVKNLKNGKVVYVKINDRGPFVKGRIIDLSSAAAKKIGIFKPGTGKVAIYTRRKY